MKLRALLFLILFTSAVKAEFTLDSLRQELAVSSSEDSLLVLKELAALSMRQNLEDALEYSRKYNALSQRLKSQEHQYQSNFRLGVVFKYGGEYDSSLIYLKAALQMSETSKDSVRIGRCYNALGVVFKTTGDFKKAQEYYERALEIARELKDLSNQAKIYNNIGLLLQLQGRYAEALENFRASIQLKLKLKDDKGLIVAYNNIALNFSNLDQFDKAIQHYKLGLKYSNALNDKYSIGVLSNNLGEAYLQADSIDQAIRFLNESVELRLEIEDEIGLAKSYFHFGNLWSKLNKTDRAERYYKDAIFILEKQNKYDELNAIYQALGKLKYQLNLYKSAIKWFKISQTNAQLIGSRSDQLINYEYLAQCFESLNQYDSAYVYLKKTKQLSDELIEAELEKKLQEQQVRYEAEFNQNTIRQLREAQNVRELERNRDRVIFYIVLISLVTAGVLLILVLRQNQLKKRHAKELEEHNIQIEKQNKSLEKAKLQAEEASRVKSDFLASVSHEIRTPLNGVIGMAELLYNTPLAPTQQSYLDTIKNSSDNLLMLMNDILDFSKIESTGIKLTIRRNSLRTLLKNIFSSFENLAANKELNFDLEIAEDVPDFVYIDASRVRQIIGNLLSNAFKFTHLGFVTLKVEVLSKEKTLNGEKVAIRISVVDSGVGISKELKEKIFKAFNRADTSITRRYGGIGLGLAISQSLAELMGSTIEIESEISRGTKIQFTLDVKAEKTDPHEKASRIRETGKRENIAETSVRYPLDICIAEDNEINQELLKITLQKMGYDPIVVSNGEAVLDKLNSQNIDLVFMDIQMPVMDGVTATKRIRTKFLGNKEYPVIIAVTANTYNEDRSNYLNAGMNDYIAKPFTSQEIQDAIKKWYSVVEERQKLN